METINEHNVTIAAQIPALNLNRSELEYIFKQVLIFLDVIKLQNGIAHTELKYYQNQVYIIESQTRPGGGYIWQMVKKYTGYDEIAASVKLFSNHKHLPPPCFSEHTKCVYHSTFITPKRSGILGGIVGLKYAKQHPNVVFLNLNVKKGQIISPKHDATDYIGFIVIKGSGAAEVSVVQAELKHQFYLTFDDKSVLSIFE